MNRFGQVLVIMGGLVFMAIGAYALQMWWPTWVARGYPLNIFKGDGAPTLPFLSGIASLGVGIFMGTLPLWALKKTNSADPI